MTTYARNSGQYSTLTVCDFQCRKFILHWDNVLQLQHAINTQFGNVVNLYESRNVCESVRALAWEPQDVLVYQHPDCTITRQAINKDLKVIPLQLKEQVFREYVWCLPE